MNIQKDIESEIPAGPKPFDGYVYSPEIIPGFSKTLDLLAIMSAAVMTWIFASENTSLNRYIFLVLFYLFVYMQLASHARLFELPAVMRPISRFDDVLIALITTLFLFLAVVFALEVAGDYGVRTVFGLTALSLVAIGLFRYAASRAFRRMSKRGIIGSTVAVLGTGRQGSHFLRRLAETRPLFTSVVGVFDVRQAGREPGGMVEGHAILGGLDALLQMARERKIDHIVVALPWADDQHVMSTVETLKELPVNVYLSTEPVGYEIEFRPVMGDFRALPVFEVVQRPISGWSAVLKMLGDYVISLSGLIIVSPLLLLIMIAIKLDTPGPILFRQTRLGFNNKEFAIFKFRSMHHRPLPEVVVQQATRGDPRVTRVGRFIRATSLDELPQLLNVLNGTMSLVGPRPHAVSHNLEYGRQIRGYFARHKVKPGITGWAQVNGFRGEIDEIKKMEKRIKYDVYYAENWSIFFDMKIIIMTFIVVLFQKNAY